MQTDPATTAQKNFGNKILIGVFFLLLFAPTLDFILRFDPIPPAKENRNPAPAPHFSRSLGLKRYFHDVEEYFNDHFGLRNSLLRLHNKTRYSLLADQTSSNVLIGKDDWLFYTAGDMADHYRGTLRFSDQKLQTWQKLLEYRRDWLAKRGIKYIFVVAPDKHSIYSEELPDWLRNTGTQTKLDQLAAYMKAHSTVPFVDLRAPLIAGKKVAPTYFNTDTHWNAFGGLIASREMMAKLSNLPPPFELDAFNRKSESMPGGDLVAMLGLDASEVREMNCFQVVARTNELRNIHPTGRALIYHDSFGAWLKPYLGYYFADVSYLSHYELNLAEIEKYHPDVVISEMVERHVNTLSADGFLKNEQRAMDTASR